MITKFAPGNRTELADDIREWVLEMFSKGIEAASASGNFSQTDGTAIIGCTYQYADFAWLSSK